MTSPKRHKAALDVLVIEPYFGGSHRSFVEGLRALPFNIDLMTLPGRRWKWRMRLSAPYFARRVEESGRRWDRIVCSSFLDVAAFRGLAPSWVREVPVLVYYHENQFEYPVRALDERDIHFGITNMTTAMASDAIAFNSSFNLESFLRGVAEIRKLSTDIRTPGIRETIRAKSTILPPGMDFSSIDRVKAHRDDGPPAVLWNHRWEHDKNPELFFETLYALNSDGADFTVIVLGESFDRRPAVFDEARKRLSKKILHMSYARSREEYERWLVRGDIVVSTAMHEFFGMAVLEAVRAGCRPLLPDRLSYPEMFPREFLYGDDSEFGLRLGDEIERGERLSDADARGLTERYSWDALLPEYESWISRASRTG